MNHAALIVGALIVGALLLHDATPLSLGGAAATGPTCLRMDHEWSTNPDPPPFPEPVGHRYRITADTGSADADTPCPPGSTHNLRFAAGECHNVTMTWATGTPLHGSPPPPATTLLYLVPASTSTFHGPLGNLNWKTIPVAEGGIDGITPLFPDGTLCAAPGTYRLILRVCGFDAVTLARPAHHCAGAPVYDINSDDGGNAGPLNTNQVE